MIDFQQNGNRFIYSLTTDMVVSNIPEIRDYLVRDLDGRTDGKELVLDLKQVQTIDAIGVNCVVGLSQKAKRDNLQFEILNCNESILRVFELFRLDKQFSVKGIS